ncbi:alpha/beta hydrolase [Paenibacillus sp. L3-i20]|uniref:alpha/beta hydrolase family protein n=1 Tax=Paenibacillus sp. L3-i20 TaxID=2905833 RepID=UPI001EE09339|nr:alpha/beta hydrolase [Paenibacillus sp. L3-i20]GKU76612.1 carboxylic ester hydrolase [Paenibacillus sp. L3-i20]
MGLLVLFVTLIIEFMLAIYCVTTKQIHSKLRSWIRIALFTTFVLLTLSSVIVWDFRWVMLAILLFILAVIGTVSLIRNKANTKEYKSSRMIGKAMLMTFALLFVCIPALVFPQYKLPKVTGEYNVATATYTYTDENHIEQFTDTGENRFVNVQFWYPENADGTYPLLIFSHGAYGIKDSNTSTYTELASNGYVVVSIDHPYHSFYTVSDDGTTTLVNKEYMREISNLNTEGIYTPEEVYGLIQKWMKLRTDDINFVIDTILHKSENDNNPIYQLIDTSKIGVFGHSMGGAASVWVGKERDDISAVVNIDAPLFSELIYNTEIDNFAASSEVYTTPLLNIYSDDVWVQLETIPVYAANKTIESKSTEAYTVHFKGAKHLSLTDLPLFAPVFANILQGGRKAHIDKYYCIETQNELILKFFNYKLKGTGSFEFEETY